MANYRHPYPETGDPHIVWFYKEMLAQGKNENQIATVAGVSSETIRKMKRMQQINFVLFKAMLEVLGYEIMIVAREAKNGSNENVN